MDDFDSQACVNALSTMSHFLTSYAHLLNISRNIYGQFFQKLQKHTIQAKNPYRNFRPESRPVTYSLEYLTDRANTLKDDLRSDNGKCDLFFKDRKVLGKWMVKEKSLWEWAKDRFRFLCPGKNLST